MLAMAQEVRILATGILRHVQPHAQRLSNTFGDSSQVVPVLPNQ